MKKSSFLVLFSAAVFSCAVIGMVEARTGQNTSGSPQRGTAKASGGVVAVSPTGREVTGQLVISEGQQGKADEVVVRTDDATFRIKPTPILNNLLNLDGECRFRFLLERVGEGDEVAWQIVRYSEVPLASPPANLDGPADGDASEMEPVKPRKPAKPGKSAPGKTRKDGASSLPGNKGS